MQKQQKLFKLDQITSHLHRSRRQCRLIGSPQVRVERLLEEVLPGPASPTSAVPREPACATNTDGSNLITF